MVGPIDRSHVGKAARRLVKWHIQSDIAWNSDEVWCAGNNGEDSKWNFYLSSWLRVGQDARGFIGGGMYHAEQ